MLSVSERRKVARRLRAKYAEREAPGMFVPQDVGLFYEVYLRDLESCVPDGESLFTVFADLIDPPDHDQVIANNLALIDRNRELERELAACKARLGAASRVADACRERARAICDGRGDREIYGSDLGRMHAYYRVADELAEAVGA